MTYKNFKELNLTQFSKGEKITIIKHNDFGYPVAYHLTLDTIFLRDYAQYTDCLQIQGKKPRARKLTALIIKPYQDFAIYRGFVEVNNTSKVISDGAVRVTTLGLCFSEDTLKKSFPENYVISTL